MGVVEIIILAIGLSMDAFAVSVCKGLALRRVTLRHAAVVGAWFGGFQALMPLIGYYLGIQFKDYIVSVDHWIAFVLLTLIGLNMVKESFSKKEEKESASLAFRTMIVLAVATSIDALAIGVTFAFLDDSANIYFAVCSIGVITFLLSAAGVKIGNIFGVRYKAKAELAGGIILILLGFKILLEHLEVLPF